MPKQAHTNLLTALPIVCSALSLALGLSFATAPVWSQSIMEAGGLHAGVAGLGAGLAASQNHGAAVRNTYEVAAQTQQAILAQNKAIEQYLSLGTKYEAKKEWAAAEKCYAYVLQVVNRRDGPGSASGLPALKHLVSINVAQNKINEAIGFQRTVVAFTERAKKINPQAVIQTKLELSNLFIKQNDYSSAEPVLQQSAVIAQNDTSITKAQRKATLRTYSSVLRKLKKTTEAESIEAALAADALKEEALADVKAESNLKPEVKAVEPELTIQEKLEEKLQEKQPAKPTESSVGTKASAEPK